jgi:putative NADPH-quinone reductase
VTRAVLVHCHPRPESFTAAVRDAVTERLEAAGAEIRTIDLYARGFDPCLSAEEHERYLDGVSEGSDVAADCADLQWCDTLLFTYPTWWYGTPAALKGWLDRTLAPGVAFHMPTEHARDIRPGLTNIRRLGCFTTCGASRWLTAWVGHPGRRTILRGVRLCCHPRTRTAFAAHYLIDSSTPESRAAHLGLVARRMDRLIGAPGDGTRVGRMGAEARRPAG